MIYKTVKDLKKYLDTLDENLPINYPEGVEAKITTWVHGNYPYNKPDIINLTLW